MKISHKKQKLLLLAGYAAVLGVFWALKLPCVFQHFLHIPCPGCGMTRAVAAVFRLDFLQAFRLHPMVWSLPVLGAYFLFDGGIFRKPWMNKLLLAAIGVGFLAVWGYRLVFC